MYYQQGDCLFKTIPSIPKKAKVDKTGILIKSPATGHAHVVKGAKVLSEGDKTYIQADKKCKVVHEEHFDMILPKGLYEYSVPLEYDHMTEESRAVID